MHKKLTFFYNFFVTKATKASSGMVANLRGADDLTDACVCGFPRFFISYIQLYEGL